MRVKPFVIFQFEYKPGSVFSESHRAPQLQWHIQIKVFSKYTLDLPESPKTNTFTLSREAIFVPAESRKKVKKTRLDSVNLEFYWLSR